MSLRILSAALFCIRFSHPRFLQRVVLSLAVLACSAIALAQTATTTTLTVSPSTSPLVPQTVVTLTATVKAGGTSVQPGLVTFCDTSIHAVPACSGLAVVGSAQLLQGGATAGVANVRVIPGGGSHSYIAVFAGTHTYATSTSAPQTITALYRTTSSIASSGSAGSYTLTGTVVGTGSFTLAPTSNVSFVDTTIGYVLGTAPLGAPTLAQSFAPGSPVTVGTFPEQVVTGDFNGDGAPDLAVANSGSGDVSILLGNGDGTFKAPVTILIPGSGINAGGLAVGDFNGDGNQDLAVIDGNHSNVYLLLGDGTGNFTVAGSSLIVGSLPHGIAVGDFNGDGNADIAVGDYNVNVPNSTVSILLGNGDGTFQPRNIVNITTGDTQAWWITVGDFNEDGNLDVQVSFINSSRPGALVTLLGDGTGNFPTQTRLTSSVVDSPYTSVVGDLNGDGHLDVVVGAYSLGAIAIALGDGTGNFAAGPNSPISSRGSGPYGIAIGDFNGDGIPDIAVDYYFSGTEDILFGDGHGSFTFTTFPISVGSNPRSVAAADFNGDGTVDLAVVTYGSGPGAATVLLNQVTQTATATLTPVTVPGSGTHDVNATYPRDTEFDTSTSTTTPLTASPVATTLTLSALPTSSTYGQQVVLTATLSPNSIGNLATNGQPVNFITAGILLGSGTLASGVATFNTTSLPLGVANLQASFAGDPNFLPSSSSILGFTVSQATPTITWANPAAITYGTPLSATQLNATANVPGTFVYGPAAGAVLNAGTQTLNVTFTPTDIINYTTATMSVTLIVNQAVLTVTANPGSRVYGAANPAFTSTITGFVNGDPQVTVTGSPSLTTTATTASPAGPYPITAALGTLAATNYTFTFVNGTLTVNPAVLTVTANPASRAYGAANPSFTSTITGFVNGDTQASAVTGTASLTTTATTASPAGPYPITAALGTLIAANYSFTFVNGTLTVTQAVLTVTASPASRAYGTANPAFSSTITGFVNGDAQASAVTGLASLTTAATTASAAGTYPITAARGTLAAANYSFAFVNGTLTVTQAMLTVTVNPASRAYGAANPAFTSTITGFVNGDTQTSAVTGTASLTTTAATASPVGTYPITAAPGTLAATNYTFTFVNGTLTVAQAVLTVTANNLSRVYGVLNPSLTTTITGFVNGDTQTSAVAGSASLTTTATTASAAGTYPITATLGTLTAANYGFTFVNGTLTVIKATPGTGTTPPVTTTSSLNPAIAGSPVVLTATVPSGATGSVSFFDGTTLLGTGTISGGQASLTTSALSVGTHSITSVYGGDSNYSGSTSIVLSQVIISQVTVSVADFAMTSSTGSQLIPPGASASYNIVVSSVNPPFTNPVTMSASNLPPGATYTFTPAAVTPGAASANTTFTIIVPKQSAALHTGRLGSAALALLLLPFAWLRRSRGSPYRLLLWMLVALGSLATVSGCGAGGYFSQPEQTYTITVTGTSGTLVHSTTVTLTVE